MWILKGSDSKGWIHEEWNAPAHSTMICAELAPAIYPILAPYPEDFVQIICWR